MRSDLDDDSLTTCTVNQTITRLVNLAGVAISSKEDKDLKQLASLRNQLQLYGRLHDAKVNRYVIEAKAADVLKFLIHFVDSELLPRLNPPDGETAELSLALRHPDLPHAGLHRGVVLSEDLNHPDDGWATFDVRYWVWGTAPDTRDRYFDLVTEVWREWGWATRDGGAARTRTGWADTPDGYGLALTRSVNGYLSMAGSTPLFLRDSVVGEPMPTRIAWRDGEAVSSL
nr:hypothetical protein [Streptomyces sp. CEV 2-1]